MIPNTSLNPERYNLYNFELRFKNYLSAVNENRDTIKNYLSDFRHFSGFTMAQTKNSASGIPQNEALTDLSTFLSEELITDYKLFLVSSNLPRNTINRRLSTVRKFCSFCISQGWLKENPARNVENISNKKEKQASDLQTLKEKSHEKHAESILAQYTNYLDSHNLSAEQLKKEINYVQEFLTVSVR